MLRSAMFVYKNQLASTCFHLWKTAKVTFNDYCELQHGYFASLINALKNRGFGGEVVSALDFHL
jgi:hypothetical protein